MEGDFATNGRDAKTVSVRRNTVHNAAKEEAVFNVDVSIAIDIAEAKAVQNSDWPCAHADDVADDAADAGCGAIKWFDIAWVVVRFHLEDDALASVT